MGTRSNTASKCNITRKTVNDWKNITQSMKITTKKKVLEQLLEHLPEETFEYSVKKMSEASGELLLSFLAFVYERVFDLENNEDIRKKLERFEQIVTEYLGLIHNRYEHELSNFILQLHRYSKYKGIEWNPSDYHLYDSETYYGWVESIVKENQPNQDNKESSLTVNMPLKIRKELTELIEGSQDISFSRYP